MKGPSIATRVFLKILEGAQHGQVKITFPDGKVGAYGSGGLLAVVTVADWDVFDLLFKKGDIGLAEAIITDRMQVSDVSNLVEWACRNDQALGEAFRGKWYGVLAERLKHLLARNSREGAKNNIVAHYDLGNDFYRLWLDQSMTYSSAIFKDDDTSLHSGQMQKYDRIIEQLEIKSTDHILEIGCGWGGFFSRAVEKTGCKVTAVMNSPSQANHNRQMIEKNGMVKSVELCQVDYRDIQGKFDKVVSIEMVEAVGEQYWNDYFKKVTSSLKSRGKAMIQGITIREDLFYSYRKSTDFIQQYVFPGGMLLTDSVFENQSEKNSLHLEDKFKFPGSYARTLQIWRENFNTVLPDLKQMGYDDKFIRLWNLYLAYCEGAFRAGRISVGQYQIVNS